MALSRHLGTDAASASSAEASELRRALEELNLLNDVAVTLGAATDLDAVLTELVGYSVDAVQAEQGVIVLDKPGADKDTLVRMPAGTGTDETLRPGYLVVSWMQVHQHPLILNSPATDARFGDSYWPPSIRNLVAVPMLAAGRFVGMLTLFNKRELPAFTDDDARLLTILASQSALLIERVRAMREKEQAEAKRAEVEAERERLLHALGLHTAPTVVDAMRQQVIAGLQARFDFTPQEARVALLLAERKTNREVADALVISPHTARHHTERVLKKLGLVSRRAVADALGLEAP